MHDAIRSLITQKLLLPLPLSEVIRFQGFGLAHRVLLLISVIVFQSCLSEPDASKTSSDRDANKRNEQASVLPDYTLYKGSMSHPEYDSVYNELYLYKNESFRLKQVDRIGEHYLHEKTTHGIFAKLKDDRQIGLFLSEGTLILRLAVTDTGLYLMDMEGKGIVDSAHIWKVYNQE